MNKNHKNPKMTSYETFKNRRSLLKKIGIVSASLTLPNIGFSENSKTAQTTSLNIESSQNFSQGSELTPEKKITSYNNFYELGWNKDDPSKNAQFLKPDPWTLTIDGEVENPLTLSYKDLLTLFPLEERIYRFRCVEAWSMVIPWIGFELNKLLDLVKPTSDAKFVAFQSLHDEKQMPNLINAGFSGISFPYKEGLRLDEATHPLTILSVGLYGKTLLPQNGAPIRLVVPWKYGFKSIKSIVHIKLVKNTPQTTWNMSAPNEYGFYANVNPKVSHPRWSQASERVIGTESFLSVRRIPTLPFNGYQEEVSDLYSGMDLVKNY